MGVVCGCLSKHECECMCFVKVYVRISLYIYVCVCVCVCMLCMSNPQFQSPVFFTGGRYGINTLRYSKGAKFSHTYKR